MNHTLNWSNLSPPATWKRNGRELRGPCPVTGEGDTKAWAVPNDDVIGCRLCGDGSGKLTGQSFKDHAAALELLHVDLGAAGGAWDSWTWTTADERERKQYRTPNGKRWATKDAPAGGWPKPADLLYLPGGLPTAPIIYICEGASDAYAVHGFGLPALGRTNARPSPASLARLDHGAVYRLWPDVDDDGAGYKQAVSFATAATAAGLVCEMIDPLILRPDAPSKFDARNWIESLPAGTTADAAAALLDSAVVDLETIRGRIPTAPITMQPTAAPAPAWIPPADGLSIPREFVELCDSEEGIAIMVATRAAGRLRHVADSGEWLSFTATGWRPVLAPTVEETLADCARQNIGTVDTKTGENKLRPASSGRKSVGRAVAGLLAGREEITTRADDWDSARNVILMPNGDLFNVLTSERRRPTITDLLRRRVRIEPASVADYDGSRFRSVVEHVVPDPTERTYLQRRLGAALADAEGMDDLLWLYGPPGSGKGTIVRALKATLGDYAGGVPINELLRGMNRGHSAWLARLAGCRYLFADDVPVGRYVDDSTVNKLLGSETTAQHMRCQPFDFRLHAPLICTANAPPQITSTNVRRLRPIQCGVSVPVSNQNPEVRASMSTDGEIAACLRWLLDGARDWKQHGCPLPESCIERAEEAAASSPVAEFTATFKPGEQTESSEVFRRWRAFKIGLGEQPGSHKAMVGELRAAGWIDKRSHGVRYLRVPHGAASAINLYTRIPRPEKVPLEVNTKSGTMRHPAADSPVNIDDAVPPDFPSGALDGPDDQGPAPPDRPAENPETPPPAPAGENSDDGAPPILWKPHMDRDDPSTPAECAYCSGPLADGYKFTACAKCCRDVQAYCSGENTTGPAGEPVQPMPLPDPIRRVTYAIADPRRLAAVAAGREPSNDEWREWAGLQG